MKKRLKDMSIASCFVVIAVASLHVPKPDKPQAGVIENAWSKEAYCQQTEQIEVARVKEPEPVEEPLFVSLGEFKLTAYCGCEKCCGQYAKNRPVDDYGTPLVIGASGSLLQDGISIAVDTNVIPYGTKVFINGKEYIAHDCGGAVDGNHIDIYFDSHETALQFGVQYAEVFIKEGGENGGY